MRLPIRSPRQHGRAAPASTYSAPPATGVFFRELSAGRAETAGIHETSPPNVPASGRGRSRTASRYRLGVIRVEGSRGRASTHFRFASETGRKFNAPLRVAKYDNPTCRG